MGVRVTKQCIIYGDYLSTIVNVTTPGSQLKKKYLALSYHYCQEHFSARIVNIHRIDGQFNYADPYSKALGGTGFHGHYNEITEN